MSLPRLLYLGYAFPPGLEAIYPGANPAGHGFETRMIAALRQHFEIRSAGILRVPLPTRSLAGDPSTGIAHDILLAERSPEIVTRRRALATLQRRYQQWRTEGWMPDAILVYNLGPIYNAFIRWLRRQSPRPCLVLLLLDSVQLGTSLPLLKRLRYRLKPLVVPDADMLQEFDACIGLSIDVENYFKPSRTPFLWMPGACDPARRPAAREEQRDSSPMCFGYFGALASHAGVSDLVDVFLQSPIRATLRICGYGKLSEGFARRAQVHERFRFYGLLAKPDDCLPFGQTCDVLVNPRPPGFGNQNNFPSKLFDYALCGRAILSSRISGVEQVLGPDAFYYDAACHPASLLEALEKIAALNRVELRHRGKAIHDRVCTDFNWANQARRLAAFLEDVCREKDPRQRAQP